MMEGQDERGKVSMKDDQVQIEQTVITLTNGETNNRRQVMSKDVGVQTEQVMDKDVGVEVELTAIIFDDEERNNPRDVMSNDVETNSSLPNEHEMVHLNLNTETFDQSQVAVPLKNSNNASVSFMEKSCQIVDVAMEESNLTTTDLIDDIIEDPRPILGYANEPLLPLYKACVPLTEIIHNIAYYVQQALDKTPEEPPDGLTIDESAAIRLYTIEWAKPHRSLYSMLNYTLKKANREQLRPYFKYLKLFLTALVKLPCVPSLTVWRGVTEDLSTKFPSGKAVTWWAFSSCTTEMTVLENNMYLGTTGKRTLFSVEAVNGRDIGKHSRYASENEVLLLPGTYMIVQSQVSPAPDLYVIHLKQVIPEETLLEPPFEGISKIFRHLF